MAHEIESMFYTGRETPWHGLGISVKEAPTSADALKLAGLDWNVESKPIFTESGIAIPGYCANVRDSDGSVLGVVSKRYQIVQNKEAFEFTDKICGNDDVRYETAGSLRNGKKIWLLARMPQTKILGDAVDPYICFTNSHDGFGSIKVCMTPIRVVCNNTLNFALESANRKWSTRHIGDLSSKLIEAERTLELANTYMKELATSAERFANITINEDALMQIINTMLPINNDATDRQKANIEDMRDKFTTCYFAPDIAQFMGTAWGVLNAASDFATHSKPNRSTANYRENNWDKVIEGHPIMDNVFSTISSIANI